LISCSYQLADAFAGIGYTFFATLAILYFMKFVVYIFKRCVIRDGTTWWATTGFSESYILQDRLQATEQQRWGGAPAPIPAGPQPGNPAIEV
jgi:ammonium transporter, Amt family